MLKTYRWLRRGELVLLGCLGLGLFVNGILGSDRTSLVLGAGGVATVLVLGFGRQSLRIVFSSAVMVIATVLIGFVAVHQLARRDWLSGGIGVVGFLLGSSLVGAAVRKRWRSTHRRRTG